MISDDELKELEHDIIGFGPRKKTSLQLITELRRARAELALLRPAGRACRALYRSFSNDNILRVEDEGRRLRDAGWAGEDAG